MTKRLVLALVVLAMAFSATAAVADQIDFNFAGGPGGSYTFTGSGTFSGTESPLTVHEVNPIAGPNISMGSSVLTWTTGAYTGTVGGTANFAAGGTVTVSGCGGTCFLGTFTGAQFDVANLLFYSTFVAGNVDPSVWTLVGLPALPSGATGTISANLGSYNGRGGAIASGDLTLTRVPEPTSLALLGSGLLLAGSVMRRKLSL